METDTIENSVDSSRDTVKPRFCEVCQNCGLDHKAMQSIAKQAKLYKCVIDAMAVGKAVRLGHALKILAALSEHTGQTWTLDNVRVAILPTFADFHNLHNFDLDILSTTAGVPFDLICMMLNDKAVPWEAARLVLRAASQQTGQKYTMDNVDVRVTEGVY